MPDTELYADLRGRTALVTGGARGIGLALASHLARAGARVGVADVDEDTVEKVVEDTVPGGLAIGCDVSHGEAASEAVDRIVTETGSLDILVNNAGILRDGMLWKLSDDDWSNVLAVHLTGTFNMTRAAVGPMRRGGYGRIINITSYSGLHGNLGQANYSAAKAGIIGFTRTAAKELARFGITVNAVSPNASTAMVESIPEARRSEIEAMIPLGRFDEPEEVAHAVGFLASREAGYVTGVVLPVDGGLSI